MIVAVVGIHRLDWSQPANANIACLVLILLWLIGASVWIRFVSGWSRPLRRRIAVGVLVLLVAFIAMFRFEGFAADLMPTFAPRWYPRKYARHLQPVEGKAHLAQSTPRDFPQFLGPNRNGILPDVQFATDWKKSPPKVLWRKPQGAGWSSFAVVGDYAVTQDQQQGDDGTDLECVNCYKLTSGELIWSHADLAFFSEFLGGDGPRATPTIYEGRVYSQGATGIVNALDGATGKPIWTVDLKRDFGAIEPTWGFSGSPLIVDKFVVISSGAGNNKSLLALDHLTGKLVWSSGNDPVSYSSPMLATLGGKRQIVVVNAASVAGFDPAGGQLLWRYDWPAAAGQPTVPQPVVVANNRLLITKGYGVGATLLELVATTSPPWTVRKVWDNNELKAKFSNVVVRDGYAYGIDERLLECVNLATGKRVWRTGRGDDYAYGQILLVGDKLLILTESGNLTLVAADPKQHTELARMKLFESKTWNNPVLAGRYLVARNDREAACVELPAP